MHSGSESEASVGCLSSHPKTTKPQICSPLHPPTSTSSSAFPLFLGRPGSLTCSARSLRGLFWVCSQCPRQTHVHSFSSLTHPVQTLRLCKYCFPRHLSPLHDQTVMCLPEPCAVGALKVKERSLIPFSSTVARCQRFFTTVTWWAGPGSTAGCTTLSAPEARPDGWRCPYPFVLGDPVPKAIPMTSLPGLIS